MNVTKLLKPIPIRTLTIDKWVTALFLLGSFFLLVHLQYKTMSNLKIENLERVKEVIRKGMRFLRFHLLQESECSRTLCLHISVICVTLDCNFDVLDPNSIWVDFVGRTWGYDHENVVIMDYVWHFFGVSLLSTCVLLGYYFHPTGILDKN